MSISLEDVRNFKGSRDRAALFRALKSADPLIREAAVVSLIEIEDPRDVDAVKKYLVVELDLYVLGQVLPVLHTSKLYKDSAFLDQFLRKTIQLAGSLDPHSPKTNSDDVTVKSSQSSIETGYREVIREQQRFLKILGTVFLISSLVSLIFMVDSPFAYRMLYFVSGLLFGAISIAFFVFAKKKSGKKSDASHLEEDVQSVEREEVRREHFTRLFHHRDIFAMGILYEGELPEHMSVTPSLIADEVLSALHQDNKYIDDRLSFHAVIKMERVADYKFFSSEDYLPGSDLDDLMHLCMEDVRKMVVTDDPLIEKIAAQMSKVKVRTPTLGVVWVGMYISMI
jgi:hypothetical protein